jgi:hypothetical protein
MTITLLLQHQEEAKLIAVEQAKSVSTEVLVCVALDRILAEAPDQPAPKRESRPIWEVIADNMKDVPAEDLCSSP